MLYKSTFVLLALLIVGWGAFPGAAAEDRPVFLHAGSATPQVFRFAAVSALFVPGPAPPSLLGALPNSTLPHTETICSIEDDVGGFCSVAPALTDRCSMQCDQAGNCSAWSRGGFGVAFCSVSNGDSRQQRCSVLPPGTDLVILPSCTSLFGVGGGSNASTRCIISSRRLSTDSFDVGAN